MAEIEIGIGKSGRRAYGFDDIAIVPSRRTRDPEDVDITWQIDAYTFDLPVLASAMDGVRARSIRPTGKCQIRSMTWACEVSARDPTSLLSRPSIRGPTPFRARTVAKRGASRAGRMIAV